ncbi:hypothetical protein [uncultured Sphaerochaeta sp.]|uniref:hypothetical protein n=1 Tax=uncultured Sphaerochaeta sp. TaxID=886478 RepID=UPI002625EE08|nr:hypothetical protein [uncultured Sphaerochaeta sp.]
MERINNKKPDNVLIRIAILILVLIALIVLGGLARAQGTNCGMRFVFDERTGRYGFGDTTCWHCGWDLVPHVYMILDSNNYQSQLFIRVTTKDSVRFSHPRNCVYSTSSLPLGINYTNNQVWFGWTRPWITPSSASSPWGLIRYALPATACYATGCTKLDTLVIHAWGKAFKLNTVGDTCYGYASWVLPPCYPLHLQFDEIWESSGATQSDVDTVKVVDLLGRSVQKNTPGVIFLLLYKKEYDKYYTKTIFNE